MARRDAGTRDTARRDAVAGHGQAGHGQAGHGQGGAWPGQDMARDTARAGHGRRTWSGGTRPAGHGHAGHRQAQTRSLDTARRDTAMGNGRTRRAANGWPTGGPTVALRVGQRLPSGLATDVRAAIWPPGRTQGGPLAGPSAEPVTTVASQSCPGPAGRMAIWWGHQLVNRPSRVAEGGCPVLVAEVPQGVGAPGCMVSGFVVRALW